MQKKISVMPLFNRYGFSLVLLALGMNIVFLWLHNPHVFFSITQAHGELGYHFYHNEPLKMNPNLHGCVRTLMDEQRQLIDYDVVLPSDFDTPVQSFLINDTIGYGLLLGGLWKLTHSLKFRDVQILQLIIFSLLMLVFFQLAYLLFGSWQIAFCCGVAQLMFFPLLAYNVMPVRDVWAYYGLLVLSYAALAFVRHRIEIGQLVGWLLFVVICHWMRPTLFLAVVLQSLFFGCYAVRHREQAKRLVQLVGAMWLMIGLFFWLPFISFNRATYDRWVVSPAGQSMLEGLGEIENPWGHQLSDAYVNDFISKKYGLQYGTVAFDEAAMHEFKQCVHEQPLHYIKTLFFRLPDVLLPGLQWIFYEQSPYEGSVGIWEKLKRACSSPSRFILFVLRQLYMRLYLLLGYLGMFFLWHRKQRFVVLFTVCCVLFAGLSTYPSHIEYRYIVPFYWGFSLFVGQLLYVFFNILYSRKNFARIHF